MSRFVEESERKRIERLNNIKSSFTGTSVPRRHMKQVSKKDSAGCRKLDNGDFRLRNLCGSSVRTKSGLKLTVSDCESGNISSVDRRRGVLLSKRSSIKRSENSKEQPSSAEGKENWTPGDSAAAIRVFRRKTMIEQGKKVVKEEKNMVQLSTKIKDNARAWRAGTLRSGQKEWKAADELSAHHVDAVATARRGVKVDKGFTHTAAARYNAGKKGRKPYVNRGVTVESLVKERDDALNILKELDKTNLIEKMSEMQISIDTLGVHQQTNQMHFKNDELRLTGRDEDKAQNFDSSRKYYPLESNVDSEDSEENHSDSDYYDYDSSFDTNSHISEITSNECTDYDVITQGKQNKFVK